MHYTLTLLYTLAYITPSRFFLFFFILFIYYYFLFCFSLFGKKIVPLPHISSFMVMHFVLILSKCCRSKIFLISYFTNISRNRLEIEAKITTDLMLRVTSFTNLLPGTCKFSMVMHFVSILPKCCRSTIFLCFYLRLN